MIEFIEKYYMEIIIVIAAVFLLTKAKRIVKKVIGIIFSLAVIARAFIMIYPMIK